MSKGNTNVTGLSTHSKRKYILQKKTLTTFSLVFWPWNCNLYNCTLKIMGKIGKYYIQKYFVKSKWYVIFKWTSLDLASFFHLFCFPIQNVFESHFTYVCKSLNLQVSKKLRTHWKTWLLSLVKMGFSYHSITLWIFTFWSGGRRFTTKQP